MKYCMMILLISLLTIEGFTQNETRRKLLTYYEQKKTTFESMPNSKDEIIFLGNSIIEGCEWNELFDDNRIKNRGISADVAEGVLIRIDEVTESKPFKIFIMIGINDLAFGYSEKEIMQNYKAIINKIKSDSPDTKIYIQSILPVNDSFDKFKEHKIVAPNILPLNKKIKKLAEENHQTYINLYDSFLLDNRLNPQYTNDGLHLTGQGYLLWKKLIEQYINN